MKLQCHQLRRRGVKRICCGQELGAGLRSVRRLVFLQPMNGRALSEKNSARSYRWVRIWLGVGVLLALLLLANSLRVYFFVARILSTQQVRRQVTQRVAAFEHDLRENWSPEASCLKLLMDEMLAST